MPDLIARVAHSSPAAYRTYRRLRNLPYVLRGQRLEASSAAVMYDGITVADLPTGGNAYAGYVDGQWITVAQVEERFPGVPVLSLTTGTGVAMGIDCEPGNIGWNDDQSVAVDWAVEQIRAGQIPVVYISGSYVQSFTDKMTAAGQVRSTYRIFSTHWNGQAHICGPDVCGLPQADATQWVSLQSRGYDISEFASTLFDLPVPTPRPASAPVPAVSVPSHQENEMIVVVVTTPSTKNTHPVFVLEANTKRWLPNAEFVEAYLQVTGQTEPLDLGENGWLYVVGPRPDAPNSSPVPDQ